MNKYKENLLKEFSDMFTIKNGYNAKYTDLKNFISTSIDKLLDEMEILIYDKFNSNYCYDKDEIKQILNKYRE